MPVRFSEGQAILEFLVLVGVTASLFLGILYLGKFHDIQAHAIQAARYAVWERTVRDEGHFSDVQLEGQIRARLFSQAQKAYKAADEKTDKQKWEKDSVRWRDHGNKQNLIDKPKDVTVSTVSAGLPGSAAEKIAKTIGVVESTVGILTDGEALNKGGLYTGTVNVKLSNIAALPAPLNKLDLTLKETSSLVTDSWDADGPKQTAMRTRAYAPASALRSVTAALDMVSGFLSLLEPAFSQFRPGQICPDIVPADRLSNGSVVPVYRGAGPCY